MRVSLFTPFLLATSVLAAPAPEKRDVDLSNDVTIINRAISNVQSKLGSLKTALDNLARLPPNYDLSQYERDIERDAKDLTAAMNNGAYDIRLGPSAGYIESVQLTTTVASLQTATNAATTSWIGAKNVIVKTAGGREAAIRMLTEHKAAAGAFADALVSRLPGLGQEIGRLFSQPSLNSINNAIEAYKR